MDKLVLQEACYLGILVAEHVYGIRRKSGDGKIQEMIDTLKAIAHGELTLVETAEERAAGSSFEMPSSLVKDLHGPLRKSRERQQDVAKQLSRGL